MTGPPIRQPPADQDLTVQSFTTGGGVSELTVTRLSNTGDPNDFRFTPVPQTIDVIYGVGFEGQPPSFNPEFSGIFISGLTLVPVPVPAALPLLASGLFALGLMVRRKDNKWGKLRLFSG